MQGQPTLSQREKAKTLFELHHSDKLLILPNIWDSIGADLLENIGYPAIATASASIAFSNGYDDGEHIPFEFLLPLLKRIASRVNIPVTADVESGFADNNTQLKENIKRLLETGIVGINIEDVDKKTNSLWPTHIHAEKIQVIKTTAQECGVPLFINARTDVYIRGKGFDTQEAKLEETIKRGRAYKDAGANCFYPITLCELSDLKKIIESLQMPVNVLMIQGMPDLNSLKQIGVARISLGPGFLKIAIRAMKDLALKLQDLKGVNEVTGNEITSAYLRELAGKR